MRSDISLKTNHNGGFLPGIILLTQCYYHPSGNLCKCHEEVLYLQPMIPPKRFDIFPSDWGMILTEGLDTFIFSLNNNNNNKLKRV